MELVNPTPFAAQPAAVADLDGAEYLVVMVKATYVLDGDGGMAPADAQRGVELADVFTGEPGASSLAYASDLAIRKEDFDGFRVINGLATALQQLRSELAALNLLAGDVLNSENPIPGNTH